MADPIDDVSRDNYNGEYYPKMIVEGSYYLSQFINKQSSYTWRTINEKTGGFEDNPADIYGHHSTSFSSADLPQYKLVAELKQQQGVGEDFQELNGTPHSDITPTSAGKSYSTSTSNTDKASNSQHTKAPGPNKRTATETSDMSKNKRVKVDMLVSDSTGNQSDNRQQASNSKSSEQSSDKAFYLDYKGAGQIPSVDHTAEQGSNHGEGSGVADMNESRDSDCEIVEQESDISYVILDEVTEEDDNANSAMPASKQQKSSVSKPSPTPKDEDGLIHNVKQSQVSPKRSAKKNFESTAKRQKIETTTGPRVSCQTETLSQTKPTLSKSSASLTYSGDRIENIIYKCDICGPHKLYALEALMQLHLDNQKHGSASSYYLNKDGQIISVKQSQALVCSDSGTHTAAAISKTQKTETASRSRESCQINITIDRNSEERRVEGVGGHNERLDNNAASSSTTAMSDGPLNTLSNRMYKCDFCMVLLPYADDMHDHMTHSGHSSASFVIVDTQGNVTNTIQASQLMDESLKATTSLIVCPASQCRVVFEKPTMCNEHYRTVHKPLAADAFNYGVTDIKSKVVFQQMMGDFSCSVCNTVFTKLKQLNKHRNGMSHYPFERKPADAVQYFHCKHCKMIQYTYLMISNHMIHKHGVKVNGGQHEIEVINTSTEKRTLTLAPYTPDMEGERNCIREQVKNLNKQKKQVGKCVKKRINQSLRDLKANLH